MFQLTFTIGAPFQDMIDEAFGALAGWVATFLGEGLLSSLICDGVIGGVPGHENTEGKGVNDQDQQHIVFGQSPQFFHAEEKDVFNGLFHFFRLSPVFSASIYRQR